MFVGITNTPRDYAWGSDTGIASLLGRSPSGKPEAELWLGAHPGSPSTIVDPAAAGGASDLASWIAAFPEIAFGHVQEPESGRSGTMIPRLPFLLKILAVGHPLSLQAHPSPERARTGFELENAAGIPLDAPSRNYRDPFHKPELLYALSESFEALCGFREPEMVARILNELRALDASSDDPQPGALDLFADHLTGAEPLRDAVGWLLRDGRERDTGEVAWLVERVVALAEHAEFLASGGALIGFARELSTITSLAAAYPGDPGIVLSLLLNRVSLRRGEVLYLPAGNIHAYLSGVGVELMAASDNVLRGGLTRKHIDVDELLDVLDFTPLPLPFLSAQVASPGVSVYTPHVPDFQLVHIEAEGSAGADAGQAAGSAPVPMRQVTLAGPGIAICTAGGFLVAGATSSVSLKRGEAVYITPDEGVVTFAGAGEVFLATTGTDIRD
jgi:mannose-6-phosphate isomerase